MGDNSAKTNIDQLAAQFKKLYETLKQPLRVLPGPWNRRGRKGSMFLRVSKKFVVSSYT